MCTPSPLWVRHWAKIGVDILESKESKDTSILSYSGLLTALFHFKTDLQHQEVKRKERLSTSYLCFTKRGRVIRISQLSALQNSSRRKSMQHSQVRTLRSCQVRQQYNILPQELELLWFQNRGPLLARLSMPDNLIWPTKKQREKKPKLFGSPIY